MRASARVDEFNRTVAELLLLVEQRQRHRCIVLTFADNRWLDMLLNWMVNLHEVSWCKHKRKSDRSC